ncbi:thioredoxin family protein [Hydrogenobaculum acidophilum]
MKEFILLLFTIPYITFGAWYNFKDGLAIAKAQNKPLMVYFYQDNCEDCKHMEMFTLSNQNVSNFMDTHFVVSSIDLDSRCGKKLGRKFGIFGTPTSVFLNPKTNSIIFKAFGDMNPNQFLKTLNYVCLNAKKGGLSC